VDISSREEYPRPVNAWTTRQPDRTGPASVRLEIWSRREDSSMGMRPLSSGSRSRRACRDHSDPVAPAFTGSSCGRAPGSHGTATPRSSWHSAWLDSISGEAEFACGRDGRHRNRGGRRASFRRDPGSRPAHSPHVWGLFTPQRKLRADPGTRELGRHVRRSRTEPARGSGSPLTRRRRTN